MSHAAKEFVGRPVGVGLFYNIEHFLSTHASMF
jgi:hypothetical protein